MSLYLDTSALVKLYVEEPGRAMVVEMVEEADIVATSMVAYPEARAAFARRLREGVIDDRTHDAMVRALDEDLPRLLLLELRPSVMRLAGRLARAHFLRGFDAIHLASLVSLHDHLGGSTRFLCFDTRLTDAAAAEGFARLA